jgi:DNA-binding NtrC family response regulator
VTIYLPLGDVSALQTRTEPMPEASTVDGSEAILVVEDEEAVRDIVREILTQRGYRVWTAHDAEAAERLFEAEGDRVNLLLTDVVMPGKSGPELYRELSQRQPDLKVLFMTGYSPADLLNGEVSATDHPFITKPFEIGALCRRVRGVLDGHPDR